MATRRVRRAEKSNPSAPHPARELFDDRRVRLLLAHSSDAICLLDGAGSVLLASPASADVLGLQPGQLEGREWPALLHPEDRAAARATLDACVTQPGRPVTATSRLEQSEGTRRVVEWTATSSLDNPAMGAIVLNCRDVTAQWYTEHALLLRSRVLESMIEGVSISDEQGTILYTNAAEDTMFGYERGELIGQPVTMQNTYPPEENERIVREVIAQLRERGAWQGVFSNRKKDGTPFETFARITALEVGGSSYWVCVQEDLTERQRAEAALESSRERLALAYQAARLGTFDWNIRTGEVVWTEEEEALYGLPPGSFSGQYNHWRQLVHPDDRELTEAAVAHSAETGEDLDTEFRIIWPDGSVRWLRARARVLRDSAGAPARMIGANEDITPRKRREEAQRFLAEAGALLASSLDYEVTLAAVARLAVPQIADYALVDLVVEGSAAQRVATSHRDLAKQRILQQLGERYPPPPDDSYGVPEVYRAGRSALVSEICDDQLRLAARDEEHLALLRALGPRSAMLVPLVVRQRVIGVVTFGISEAPRRYDGEDLAMAETLASYVAFAIDNARLYQTEQYARTHAQAAAERVARLQSVTAQLTGTLTPSEVADVVLTVGLAAVSAQAGSVVLLSPDGTELELIGAVGYPPEIVRHGQRVPLSARAPQTDTFRARIPIWVESREMAIAYWPNIAPAHEMIDLHAWANLPLLAGEQPIGALGFGFRQPRSFSPEDRSFLETLAHQCSQALERARLYQDAQRAIQVRDQFLSVAAHELKTPLTTLLGNAQLMLRRSERTGALNEQDGRTLRTIVNQTQRLNRMVLALLDISRIDTGQLSIRRARLDLHALVGRIVEEIQSGLEGQQIAMIGSMMPLWVAGDELRLEQVALNLIQNAIKYSPLHSPITITLFGGRDEVGFAVADRGIGIPADALPYLFQRFYRAQNIDTQVSGMGIGLYVVQQIVTLHGGRVEVESQEGAGSTFTVWLPRA